MDDHDWMNDNQSGWTDHSSHPSTNVNYANEFDLNAKGRVFQNENYKAGVMAGYQETRFSWTATGGSYNYDNGAYTGEFLLVNVELAIASGFPCRTLAL